MQTIFLTSSPFGPLDNSRTVIGLDPMNRFPEQVERYWRPQARCLVISAFPSDLKSCDFMRDSMEGSLRAAGLGLSVVKSHVESLGGIIGLESEINKGSTFWIDLPLM